MPVLPPIQRKRIRSHGNTGRMMISRNIFNSKSTTILPAHGAPGGRASVQLRDPPLADGLGLRELGEVALDVARTEIQWGKHGEVRSDSDKHSENAIIFRDSALKYRERIDRDILSAQLFGL